MRKSCRENVSSDDLCGGPFFSGDPFPGDRGGPGEDRRAGAGAARLPEVLRQSQGEEEEESISLAWPHLLLLRRSCRSRRTSSSRRPASCTSPPTTCLSWTGWWWRCRRRGEEEVSVFVVVTSGNDIYLEACFRPSHFVAPRLSAGIAPASAHLLGGRLPAQRPAARGQVLSLWRLRDQGEENGG